MLGPVTCAACGAKVREDRVRCLRCGAPLVAAKPAEPWRLPVSPRAAGILAGVLGLAGFAVVLTGGSSADQPAPAPAATVAAAAPAAAAAPRAVVTQPAVPVGRAEPVAAALGRKREGIAAYNRGDANAAIAEFGSALAEHPDDPEALNNLGQVLVKAGRASESIEHFDRAIQLSPGAWAYHFNRARAYAVMQQWPRAVAGYRNAARLFPEDYARSEERRVGKECRL